MKIVCCRTFGPPQTLERIEIDAPVPDDEVLIDVAQQVWDLSMA